MGVASQEAWKVISQKRKHWAQTLSDDSVWSNLTSMFDLFDWLSFLGDITLSDILFSSLISALLLDIPLADLTPWSLDWKIELPSLDQFLRGVFLKIVKLDFNTILNMLLANLAAKLASIRLPDINMSNLRDLLFDKLQEIGVPSLEDLKKALEDVLVDMGVTQYLAEEITEDVAQQLDSLIGIGQDIDKLVNSLFEEPVAKNITESRLRKGVYDETPYEQSYYDPPAVREFLRSTLYFMFKRDTTYDSVKRKLLAVAESLDVAPEIVEDIYTRLSLIESIRQRTLTWDYGWWDYSTWDADTPETVKFVNWEGREDELEYSDLFDSIAGGWWDYSHWDFFYWGGSGTEYEHPWRKDAVSLLLRDFLWGEFRRRIPSTPYLLANYTLPEERRQFTPSGRVETYAVPTQHSIRIAKLVEKILQWYPDEKTPVKERLYKTAALQLYSLRYSDNKLGMEMYRAMTEEEFKQWWLGYWKQHGLREDVLNTIYERIKPVADALGRARTIEKLRFIRRKLGRAR